MIAGGTGITPMFQIIQAIVLEHEHARSSGGSAAGGGGNHRSIELPEMSLIFANQSENDMLLRDELEGLAAQYSKLRLWYVAC